MVVSSGLVLALEQMVGEPESGQRRRGKEGTGEPIPNLNPEIRGSNQTGSRGLPFGLRRVVSELVSREPAAGPTSRTRWTGLD